jgi:CheY-like chemotaxis protein
MARILVVDDEEDLREIVCTKLTASGYECTGAKDRDEAMKSITEKKPDLILMDVNMPKIQGPEILLDIKNTPEMKDIKVAFLTNSKDPWPGLTGSAEDVSRELGAVAFLQKTDDLNELVSKVKELIGQ